MGRLARCADSLDKAKIARISCGSTRGPEAPGGARTVPHPGARRGASRSPNGASGGFTDAGHQGPQGAADGHAAPLEAASLSSDPVTPEGLRAIDRLVQTSGQVDESVVEYLVANRV